MNCIDVAIVGGGPAGAYCAFELARKGIYATIFDHSHPREKPCGGGVSPFTVGKFPFLEKLRPKNSTFTDLKIITCTNREVVTKDHEKGFNLSRQVLDEEILDMALRNGARLVNEKVVEVQKQQDFWRIETSQKSFLAKTIVGADGVTSLVRRKTIGPIPKEDLALTYGYLGIGLERCQTVLKYLERIPGYIWIFPRDKQVSIGIGSEVKYGNTFRKTLDDFICSYCPTIKIVSRFAALLPSAKDPAFFNQPCAGEDWVLVGDAAGHVDPITGEGIPYALWSGSLAAEAIGECDLKSYDRLWRKEYGSYFMERCRQKETFYNPLAIELSATLRSFSNRI